MNYIYILLLTEIILLVIAFIACGRDIMSPSVVMVGVFLIATIFAVLNVENWNIEYSFSAYILLSTGLGVFIFTESFFYVVSALLEGKKTYRRISIETEQRIIKVQYWKLFALIIYCIIFLYMQYKDELRIAAGAGFNGSGNFITYYRNAAIIDGSLPEQQINGILRQFLKVITISGYIALFIFINNVIIYRDKILKNIVYLLIVFFACIRAFMEASRLDILKYLIYTVVVTYILLKRKSKWQWNINMKLIKYGILIFLVTLPAFYFISGSIGRTTQQGKSMFEYLSLYVGSGINAFDLYVKNSPDIASGWGGECFTGIQGFFERWGLIERAEVSSGILRFVETENFRTNVYTFFRRPLHDFGVLGMYFFTTFVSNIFAVMYHFILRQKKAGISISSDLYIMIYGYLFMWIACSFMEQYSFTILTPSLPLIFALFYIIYWGLTTKFRWN